MRNMLPFLVLLVLIASAWLIFQLFRDQISSTWIDLAVHPELARIMEQNGDDLKLLARLNPEQKDHYRERFESLQNTRQTLSVLALSKENLTARFEMMLGVVFLAVFLAAAAFAAIQHRTTDHRLAKLQAPLAALARGKMLSDSPRKMPGIFGRIEMMIQDSGRQMSAQRERLRYLEHLDRWQESSRRLGHEIRTPLATLQLELERLPTAASEDQRNGVIVRALEEMQRLRRFAEGFSSLAGLGKPNLKPLALKQFIDHFIDLFADHWQHLDLVGEDKGLSVSILADEGMLRQVLINLGNNADRAVSPGKGSLHLTAMVDRDHIHLHVRDNGPGLPNTIRENLFVPYTTTQPAGSGLGLGLTLSRKIMLEHAGDLSLVASGPDGTTFRLTFPILKSPQEESQ